MKRLPIVGVMGSGTRAHVKRAAPLGRMLAGLGVHLLTGGGEGTMAAVSEAFARVRERRGRVIGVLPGRIVPEGYEPLPGYPNPWVEIPVFTHLDRLGKEGQDPLSRNHINVLSSAVIVALPGGHGTSSEVAMALRYGKPVVAYVGKRSDIPDLPETVEALDDLHEIRDWIRSAVGRE